MSDPQKPLRIPFVATPSQRLNTPTQDARLVNGYIEKDELGELFCYKRPAYTSPVVVHAGTGRGVYTWNGLLYCVFGTNFSSVNGTSVTSIGSVLVGANDRFSFEPCQGATPKLFFNSAQNAYTYDPIGGLVQVTDADYPATTVPGCAYLDGTTYVMDPLGNIQGSAINDPTSWDPLNVIKAQIESDKGVALAKQLTYVIALKEWSVEVFYDAGNSVGSPLGRVEGAKVSWGCFDGQTVREIDGSLFWMSAGRSGSVHVSMMQSLKAEIISTPAVERLLQPELRGGNYGLAARIGGHYFYVLVCTDVTLAYDIREKAWYQWASTTGGTLPHLASTYDANQGVIWQGLTSGKIYHINNTAYSDDDGWFTWDLYTPTFDGGSRSSKVVNMLEAVGDQVSGLVLDVSVSDDDYKTWSSPRRLDMGHDRPMLDDMGSFYKRAHHFSNRQNLPLRMQAVDLHVDVGTF